jgi:acetyl esterase/lipase
VRAAPGASLKIIALASWGTIRLTIARIIRPFTARPLSFRNEVARMWLGTTFVNKPDIFYSEPANHDTQVIETADFKSYGIPGTAPSDLKHADAVVIFCHGGGMMIGHPLQYLAEYKRWARGASRLGKKIVFLALQYRKLEHHIRSVKSVY